MIVAKHIIAMINHWLSTPPNTYFGSSYGADLSTLLLTPMSSDVANAFLAKMRTDIPILQQLDGEQLAIYVNDVGFEQKRVFLNVGQVALDLTKFDEDLNRNTGENSHADTI